MEACPKKLFRCSKLAITADQKTQFKTLFKGMWKNMGAGMLSAKRAMLMLKLEWLADAPDAAKLGTQGQALWKQVSTKILAKLAMKLAMQKMLTPEQWKKVRTCKSCCNGKRGGSKGKGSDCKGCKGCKQRCKGCKGHRKHPCKGGGGAPCKTRHGHGA